MCRAQLASFPAFELIQPMQQNLTGQTESGIALCFFLGILNILEEDLCTAVRSVANFKILVSFEYSFKASIGTALNHVTSVNVI